MNIISKTIHFRLLYITIFLSFFLLPSSPLLANITECSLLFHPFTEQSVLLQNDLDRPVKRTRLNKKLTPILERIDYLKSLIDWRGVLSGPESLLQDRINSMRTLPSGTIHGGKSPIAMSEWAAANKQMLDWANTGIEPTIEKMFMLHRLLREEDYEKSPRVLIPGRFYSGGLFSGIFSSKDIEAGAYQTFFWLNENKNKLHPIELATQFYRRLITVHPLYNGNGRTARLIMDWILILNGYPPPSFSNYYEAMAHAVPDRANAYRGRPRITYRSNPTVETSIFNIHISILRTLEMIKEDRNLP